MARMSAREIDQAYAEDITEQQLEMEHEMESDLLFIAPDHDEYINEFDEHDMDWAFEDDYDYSYDPYPSPDCIYEE